MAVLTIEELLARKEQQAQKGKPVSKSVFIPGLGGEVEVVPMDPSKFLEYSFQLGNSNGDGAAMLDAQCAMIYACCPLFHDRHLQDAYGCQEPHEVIAKVFGYDLDGMNALTEAITSFYSAPEEEVKN